MAPRVLFVLRVLSRGVEDNGFRREKSSKASEMATAAHRTLTTMMAMMLLAPSSAYHIGAPGTPWGATEKAAWASERKVQRSYASEVLDKITGLEARFSVEQYGALSTDPERFPLWCVRSKSWAQDKPSVLVTGGVHGYETSGVQGALRFLSECAEEYEDRFNICVAPCVSPWGYETVQRWNARAVDPNRSFRADEGSDGASRTPAATEADGWRGAAANGERAEESVALMKHLASLGVEQWACHVDLHETTDSDEGEFRPALAARDGEEYVPGYVAYATVLAPDTTGAHREPHHRRSPRASLESHNVSG